jgi:hypothetical protein
MRLESPLDLGELQVKVRSTENTRSLYFVLQVFGLFYCYAL